MSFEPEPSERISILKGRIESLKHDASRSVENRLIQIDICENAIKRAQKELRLANKSDTVPHGQAD